MLRLRGDRFTEESVKAISRDEGSHKKGTYPARPRTRPKVPTAGLSRAEKEKTEALRQSILELMAFHQATLLWLTERAVSSARPEADC